ncbi:hypothetical protein CSC70_06405 [Pseudoxanthomonas kalamensis DSM 18571]|uniref:DUF6491 family protein n=1 Tax=Pseudoxanthomonas kalamensis TaxID=289483 RepID=UPI0013911107|nr:DUF6491 family protein [Pseudoxanthomonas kalamensis]KAF1710320.1 hypothetical protein CSC70_06405 [Pseudoxanthomonas kalamensis DSM 18571]
MKQMLLLLSVLLLGACASDSRLSTDEKLSLYRAHAGAEVGSFRYTGSLSGWTPLGDSALAVWTRPNEAYLLEFGGPCQDLGYAPAISISSQSGRVSARFDKVNVLGVSGGIRIPCHIQSIRELDSKALKQAESEMREAKSEERQAEAG